MASRTKTELRQAEEQQVLGFLGTLAEEDRARGRIAKNRYVATIMAREEYFLQRFREVCREAFQDVVLPRRIHLPRGKPTLERADNVLFTDLHFGAALDGREVPLPFGHVEEARSLAYVVEEVLTYKVRYRPQSELLIHLAGDIIQNQLHDPRDGNPLAEQFAAALRLLTQAVFALAAPTDPKHQFRRIRVFCTPGNHGRNTARHRQRATHQKWDSVENMLYYALKTACAALKNVEFFIPYTPFYTYEIFGQKGFVTHGDTVLDFGSPGARIDIKSLVSQTNKINAGPVRYNLFAGGHVHQGLLTPLTGRAELIVNGCLIPPDSFAVSVGELVPNRSQTIWESVPGHIVGDYRRIDIDAEVDKDPRLDRIIKPFTGF